MSFKYLVLSIVLVSLVMGTSNAFADHDEIIVKMANESGSPGCEKIAGCYLPFYAKIDSGGSVIFSNTDSAAHTVTSGIPADGPDGKFDSSLLMAGDTFSLTLDESGKYPYFCMVHPWMEGMVIVDGDTVSSCVGCSIDDARDSNKSPSNNLELENEIKKLKQENRDLKQQIITLQDEIEDLTDLLINGLKEIYNWKSNQ